jgi:hypothetical protein
MFTELLPPAGYPIAVKYITSYHIDAFRIYFAEEITGMFRFPQPLLASGYYVFCPRQISSTSFLVYYRFILQHDAVWHVCLADIIVR